MARWITSDLHFGHKKIMGLCKGTRRGRDYKEMGELLIHSINSRVKPGDELFILGDFHFSHSMTEVMTTASRINGTKHLILGNHDDVIAENMDHFLNEFYTIRDTAFIDEKIFLSHYAHRVWRNSHRGSVHFFGHSHGDMKGVGRSMDVGIDARHDNLMAPHDLDELVGLLELVDKNVSHHDKNS